MKALVGLEISGGRVRAITVSRALRRPLRRFEIPWGPDSIDEAVSLLRSELGAAAGIGVAIGFQFLFPKHVQLPPVGALEKRRMIALEPERFFPVAGPIVVQAGAESDLVFAAESALVDRWITALQAWAPVQCVEASPIAFARAARAAKIRDGWYELDSGPEETGLAQLAGGRLLSARRTRTSKPDQSILQIPEYSGVPGSFLGALGAALGTSENPDMMLISEPLHARIRSSRIRSFIGVGLLAAAGLLFALFSASQSRQRLLDHLDAEIVALRPQSAAAEQLQGRIARVGAAAIAAREAQSSADPLAVIGVLSKRLPRDVFVMTVRAAGDEWQITGTARDAAAIIPALDADPALENVRFLAGTSRFTESRRTYETFTIGFRARPAS